MGRNEDPSKIMITEFGAARSVGGSKLLIEAGLDNVLVDIGMAFDRIKDSARLPFNSESLDAIVLTHAHLDHVGLLRKPLNSGFKGGIFCTPETAILTEQQLRRRFIFESEDCAKGFDYEKTFEISRNVDGTFFYAGHIPGSALTLFEVKAQHRKRIRLLAAYDMGRSDYSDAGLAILNSPYSDFSNIDYVIVEATYGNNNHTPLQKSMKVLEDSINDTYKKKGKMVVPAFSIMGTHKFCNFLYHLNKAGRIPNDMRFYLSTPSSESVTRVMLKYKHHLHPQFQKLLADRNDNPLYNPHLFRHKDLNKTLNFLREEGPYGVVASSAMCNIGRIVPILENTIEDEKNLVFLTNYVAEGTRGHAIRYSNKGANISFEDGYKTLLADVVKGHGFSCHTDIQETMEFLEKIDPHRGLKGIFIKHGTSKNCDAARRHIIENLGYAPEKVIVMERKQAYEL
ncbi:MBL fold metallo-hydrolase [Candidatus Woesearchaeota archaeon]|nr:MBL fold metallo-hydrolase [Candidatus Woesearchaeota archaeon]